MEVKYTLESGLLQLVKEGHFLILSESGISGACCEHGRTGRCYSSLQGAQWIYWLLSLFMTALFKTKVSKITNNNKKENKYFRISL